VAGEDKYYIFKTGIYKVGRKGTVICRSFWLFSKLKSFAHIWWL